MLFTTAPEDLPTPAELLAEEDEFHNLALREIVSVGKTFLRALDGAASAEAGAKFCGDAPPGAGPLPELAIAFDRVARAMRRTIVLTRRLRTPLAPLRDTRTAARKQIIRQVEDAIDRQVDHAIDRIPDDSHARDLRAELSERLDTPDLEDDIATRPVAEIIAEIVRDLGLATQPSTRTGKRRTPADIRALNARAAQPRNRTTQTIEAAETLLRTAPPDPESG